MNYITDNEIAIKNRNFDQALSIVKTLMDNGYVCMLSYEEDLIIINYIWTYMTECDRNEVAFIDRESLEDEIFNAKE